MKTIIRGVSIAAWLCACWVFMTACRGDGDYGGGKAVEDAGSETEECQYTCTSGMSACFEWGNITDGWCPNEGEVCCAPRDEDGTGGDGDNNGTDAEEGNCEFECVPFRDCPQQGMVLGQQCDEQGEVCCNENGNNGDTGFGFDDTEFGGFRDTGFF